MLPTNPTFSILSEIIAISDDESFCNVIESLLKHDLQPHDVPSRTILNRLEKLPADRKFKLLETMVGVPWGKVLILDSGSPEHGDLVNRLVLEQIDSEGLPGVLALAHTAKTHLNLGDKRKAWEAFCLAAARLESAPTSRIRNLSKLFQKQEDKKFADRVLRVAVIGSTTTHYLCEALFLECATLGMYLDIYQGVHGNYRQEILDQNSGLFYHKPEIVLLWNCRDDFKSASTAENLARCNDHKNLWKQILAKLDCRIIQSIPESFHEPSSGMLNWAHAAEGGEMTRQQIFNWLHQDAPAPVWFLDLAAVRIEADSAGWSNQKDWYTLQQTPSLDSMRYVARSIRGMIQASSGLSKKLLILDLDNTLWGGVIGEDGPDGIKVGADSGVGLAYRDFQLYVKSLKNRGVILAVCSKNNEEDAKAAFLHRSDMPLNLSDFVEFRANWRSKAENIQEIVKKINVGMDSVVFIDDNPLERSLVRNQVPGITIPALPLDPAEFVPYLARQRYFETYKLSKEDIERVQSYQSNTQRDELLKASFSLADYLVRLEMSCTVEPLSERNIERVYQLIHKTNQFNLTSLRHSEATVRAMISDSTIFARTFSLSDKFGGHGLIGVLIAKATSASTWSIDTWLMSCRVLGRQMEEFMMDELMLAAQQQGIKQVLGRYTRTKKNELVSELLKKMGFAYIEGSSEEGHTNWVYSLSEPYEAKCSYVTRLEG